MKKIIICLAVFAAAVCIFTGCGTNTDTAPPSETKAASETPETEISTKLDSDTHESISYAITEDEARGIADKALNDAMVQNEFGIGEDAGIFEFDNIDLLSKGEQCVAFNSGYGTTSLTENTSGNAYYAVYYTDTSELIGFAYICVDAITGDVLYTGYMGD